METMSNAAEKQVIDAAIKGSVADFEKAKDALSKGAAAHEITDKDGSNALHLASHHGHSDLASHLVDSCGFDANVHLDGQGKLYIIAYNRTHRIIQS